LVAEPIDQVGKEVSEMKFNGANDTMPVVNTNKNG
jgi:hypothetical protein